MTFDPLAGVRPPKKEKKTEEEQEEHMTLLQKSKRFHDERTEIDDSPEGIAERLAAIDEFIETLNTEIPVEAKTRRVQTTKNVAPA